MGASVSVPSLLPVGMLEDPADSQGEKHRIWTLPLQDTPPASLSWFCSYDFLSQCACLKFPNLNKRGLGDHNIGKG